MIVLLLLIVSKLTNSTKQLLKRDTVFLSCIIFPACYVAPKSQSMGCQQIAHVFGECRISMARQRPQGRMAESVNVNVGSPTYSSKHPINDVLRQNNLNQATTLKFTSLHTIQLYMKQLSFLHTFGPKVL